MPPAKSLLSAWRQDLPASIVVALVALPLCLGVALASGAPLISGLIAGIVGGIVVGALSKSLLAVVLAGIMQMLFAVTRSGVLSEFVPSWVITGMLAAIGLILIRKQVPHALGYDGDYEGSFVFSQPDGYNSFSTIWLALTQQFVLGAALIPAVSLAFLFWWDKARPDGADVLIDLSATEYVDLDNIEIINDFVRGAEFRDIRVVVRGDLPNRTAPKIKAPRQEVVYA